MARPTKIDEELIKKFEEILSAGNGFEAACNYIGIIPRTGWRWLARGKKEYEVVHKKEGYEESIYCQFYQRIKKAEAGGELRAVTGIMHAGRKTWQAYAWYLERKYPERWGKRETHVVEGGDEKKPVRVEVNLDELLDQYEAIVREIQKSSVGIVQEDSSVEQVHSSSSDPETD